MVKLSKMEWEYIQVQAYSTSEMDGIGLTSTLVSDIRHTDESEACAAANAHEQNGLTVTMFGKLKGEDGEFMYFPS